MNVSRTLHQINHSTLVAFCSIKYRADLKGVDTFVIDIQLSRFSFWHSNEAIVLELECSYH